MKIDTALLRQFIIQKFSPDELNAFLFDYFRPVYHEITEGMNQSKRIQSLFDHCLRQELFPSFLANLKRERADFNPADYTKVPIEPIVSQSMSAQSVQTNVESSSTPAEEVNDKDVDSFIHPITGKKMVRIPAGEFLYGENKESIHLDEYWIDKTPVTNADYKRFLDANLQHVVPLIDGVVGWVFGESKYKWDKQSRMYPNDKADHPVVLVSWHNAKAYVEWAEGQLPTEQEWEKAARGVNGRIYPWGNEWRDNHCNTKEIGIKKTTPVGQFSPQGDSPYGCVDMSGNVREWTASISQKNSARRVLRGGSWNYYDHLARAAPRHSRTPVARFNSVGFRVLRVRRPPSQDR